MPLNDNERIMVVYVLALEDGYYHVSYSSNLTALMQKYEKGKYCEWCKLHTPVKLLEIIPVICPKDHWRLLRNLTLLLRNTSTSTEQRRLEVVDSLS